MKVKIMNKDKTAKTKEIKKGETVVEIVTYEDGSFDTTTTTTFENGDVLVSTMSGPGGCVKC